MSQGLTFSLQELRRVILEHANDVRARDMAFIQAIDKVLSQLGVKPEPVQLPPTTSTISPTVSNTELINVIKELNTQVKTLTNIMNIILEKGLPARLYSNAVFMRLDGRFGISSEGRSFPLQTPADYIIVSPTVEAIIGFNDIEPTDNVPPIVAGGQIAVGFKTSKVNYRASTLVPQSVLPAPMYLWAFYY